MTTKAPGPDGFGNAPPAALHCHTFGDIYDMDFETETDIYLHILSGIEMVLGQVGRNKSLSVDVDARKRDYAV